ncbi:hypothetical protein O9K51_11212 [Purpureocillium lavendulum]|uniref:Piwi domain-containing protein n=1 Tax=Purpureocillium lavendulum TaxID=1247861 RepID=A0AB34FB64_9HYPO|nr:hypothetical protein O9K51_11212 [Purpureocillium lavendulum]
MGVDKTRFINVLMDEESGVTEMLRDQLLGAVKSRLELFQKHNDDRLPANILMFRDGVPESQFKQVLDMELPTIRQACRAEYTTTQPKLTVVVSVKRHQTRLYPTTKEDMSASGNVLNGTVVDRVYKTGNFENSPGKCVPQELLGQGGYLPTYQKRLEHLCLVTGGDCAINALRPALALGDLKFLQGISWTGLRTKHDFAALGLALRANANHLRALDLDFIDWNIVKAQWAEMDDNEGDFFRLALQARSVNLDEESELFEEEINMNDMALLSDFFLTNSSEDPSEDSTEDSSEDEDSDGMDIDQDVWFSEQSPNPLGMDLKMFGSWVFEKLKINDDTSEERRLALGRQVFSEEGMIGWVSDAADAQNIVIATVLNHYFCEFADWVFGADGIASLHLLAYGDFSCQGRFLEDCFMLRRRALAAGDGRPYMFYFPESERDPDLEDILARHAGFLEACPTDTILRPA